MFFVFSISKTSNNNSQLQQPVEATLPPHGARSCLSPGAGNGARMRLVGNGNAYLAPLRCVFSGEVVVEEKMQNHRDFETCCNI